MSKNFAYTTLLGTDDYFLPVYALHKSLEMVGSKYPLIVMVMDTVSPTTLDNLAENGIEFRVFPNLQSEAPYYLATQFNGERDAIKYRDYFQIMMMNKFYMYELTEYDKICYLDGDIVVRKNIDFVFNFNAPAGKFLTRGKINIEPESEETGEKKLHIDLPFIAGENLLIDPKSYKFDDIIKQFTVFGFDEDVMRTIYPRNKITDLRLSDWSTHVFHAHAHCTYCRYWEIFQIHALEDMDILCRNIINDDITVYDELKALCGEAEYRKDIDALELGENIIDITLTEDEQIERRATILSDLADCHLVASNKVYTEFKKK